MAFKRMSFEESLEHPPLSEDDLKKLREELESFEYYNPFDCPKY